MCLILARGTYCNFYNCSFRYKYYAVVLKQFYGITLSRSYSANLLRPLPLDGDTVPLPVLPLVNSLHRWQLGDFRM